MGQVFRYSLHFLDLSNQLKQEQSQRENLNTCNQVAPTHWANASEYDDDDLDKSYGNYCAAAGENDNADDDVCNQGADTRRASAQSRFCLQRSSEWQICWRHPTF